ncbi:MAG: hypothetical protein US62_C0004G0019 [Candidatus Woesebacteria bacterium GW2011_GWA1_37_8]|uniref:Uncharacterized protein n=2 Tax=Candidatus Woeseibacteriota TaxID=1752722 RepID=A0A0G0L9G6_9BACT|nr:MAG: hypothetical protein US39_C0005G0003 [Microgenomates group bacterium GW2011_GWC1_37_12b]KKQ46206.1 MAG: hypothetical protein US62_C0004G0019 [Candidatus Woesebacteria bacterium GW2011_GWA1_37_8]KKQ87617.1 MAG: hypothetical protein UT10_C0003G0021 [Candidatus Woesebacteria bacterium GW2011_GWB1_38_8b]
MMRRTFLLISSFLLFTTLAVAGKSIEKNQSKISVNVNSNNLSTEVLSETDVAESTNTPTVKSSNTPSVEEIEDSDEAEEVTATPTSTAPVIGFAVEGYIYPGSAVISKSANYLELSTSTDAKTVTDWYEKKIRENGFNVKSFVRTNTNNVVKNVIAAANANEELKIEIVNQNSGSLVKINFF